MRPSLIALLFLAAPTSGAMAQDGTLIFRENELWAQQQMIQQRALALENQIVVLEARAGTEARLRDLEAMRIPPLSQSPPSGQPPVLPTADSSPSNLDAWIAASNARVRAAAANRR